jgi:hypothetical protein
MLGMSCKVHRDLESPPTYPVKKRRLRVVFEVPYVSTCRTFAKEGRWEDHVRLARAQDALRHAVRFVGVRHNRNFFLRGVATVLGICGWGSHSRQKQKKNDALCSCACMPIAVSPVVLLAIAPWNCSFRRCVRNRQKKPRRESRGDELYARPRRWPTMCLTPHQSTVIPYYVE